ncbi:hypothetical protein CC86DRAFT_292075 [Ophiobolus disseminans]|uniref:Uncharacterized protein n=1 Tax=Ophiobolus disseminans TaxID=1469910 RepID=A0A6A7A137_9PLEO|nr:hypothetical protein CC86DRAFT_292075 [Ophiobolus disseminans]
MVHLKFPTLRDDWSLDVVNILAFLGEHNILATSQQICVSPFCFLPRLIPAPQGLLAQRPETVPIDDGISIHNLSTEMRSTGLSYFARMLHGTESSLPKYTVRVLEVKATTRESCHCPIRPRILSPFNILAVLSCALSVGLMSWAIVLEDLAAFVGILTMSMTTPLLCMGLKWSPSFLGLKVPPDRERTLLLWAPSGSITIVYCKQSVELMLYTFPHPPRYLVGSYSARGLGGIAGGITLVSSLVLYSNATWTMKAALVVAYTVLNLLYWLAAILPPHWSWHLDFKVEEKERIENQTFSSALWSAMWATQRVDWALKNENIPDSALWRDWIEEAENCLHEPREKFDAQETLRRLMRSQESAFQK